MYFYVIINKFKCNRVAASIKQKSILKIFSSFHAIKKKKKKTNTRRARWVRVRSLDADVGRGDRGPWSLGLGQEGRGSSWCPARLFPESQDSNAHVEGTMERDAKRGHTRRRETISWPGHPAHLQLTLFQLPGPPGAWVGKCGRFPPRSRLQVGWDPG